MAFGNSSSLKSLYFQVSPHLSRYQFGSLSHKLLVAAEGKLFTSQLPPLFHPPKEAYTNTRHRGVVERKGHVRGMPQVPAWPRFAWVELRIVEQSASANAGEPGVAVFGRRNRLRSEAILQPSMEVKDREPGRAFLIVKSKRS